MILNSNSKLCGAAVLNLLAWFCLDTRIASEPRGNIINNAQNNCFVRRETKVMASSEDKLDKNLKVGV